uniref:protein odr-4 homolog isoform X4 n=1 Tax=Podarcis muralis TaxID=64176 RepID=UPI0010A06916|nr:protein odr-4 homolog isoform X4 [Podarcis muralis]
MGRSYFVEEAVGQYLSELATNSQALLTGLLVGQCSQQRDYVVLAVRTPPKEEESKSNTSRRSDLSNIDEEWIAAHANQVSRMLPGGLLVLGVFTVAAPELAKEIQNTLRKLVFSVEKSVARKRLWNISEEDVSDRVALHLCSATKKMLCRTYDVQDPKSTAKPADWKYQHGLATSWLSLECTINANIHIPLPVTLASHDLEKNTRNGLARWAKQIEEAVFLINGQVREEDADLLEGQKKSARGNTPSATQSLDVRVLMQLSRSSNARSTATVQICSGSINLKDSEREYHTLPCRVFAPIVGSSVLLCDYKFGDETAREIQERFLEMLDQAVQPEDLQTAEEMNMVEVTPLKEFQDVVQEKRLTKEVLLLKLHQNIGVVIAVVVAISAAAFSFNYFSD